jgi:hypothetical protein
MATLQELVTYSITLSRSYRRQLPFRLEWRALASRLPFRQCPPAPLSVLKPLVTRSLTWPRPSSSTWGESLFITAQLVVLVVLIMAYNKQTLFMVPVMLAVGAMFYALLTPGASWRLGLALLQRRHHLPSTLSPDPLISARRACQ